MVVPSEGEGEGGAQGDPRGTARRSPCARSEAPVGGLLGNDLPTQAGGSSALSCTRSLLQLHTRPQPHNPLPYLSRWRAP